MKIAFHGAARTVTGSKHLLTLKNGKKILLDPNKQTYCDITFVSHAHTDHLYKKRGKDDFVKSKTLLACHSPSFSKSSPIPHLP